MSFPYNQTEAGQEHLQEKNGYTQAVGDYLEYLKGNLVGSLTALQNIYDIFGAVLSKDELKAIQRKAYNGEKTSSKEC